MTCPKVNANKVPAILRNTEIFAEISVIFWSKEFIATHYAALNSVIFFNKY